MAACKLLLPPLITIFSINPTSEAGGNTPMSVNDRQAYKGLFINLDCSTDRRAKIESQLSKFNLQDRYSRFPAVDGRTLAPRPGKISAAEHGCFQSHYVALESAKLKHGTVHILEDDAILYPQIEQIVSSLDSSGLLDSFDLIFTDMFVGFDLLRLREFKQRYDRFRSSQPPKLNLLDVGQTYQACMTSYLVPARAFVKVLEVLHRGLTNPSLPLDLFLRHEARHGRVRLGCIFPFVTSVDLCDANRTTITDRNRAGLSSTVVDLLRYSFFIGRDFKNIPPTLLEKLRRPKNDAHEALISAVLGFVIFSSEFSSF